MNTTLQNGKEFELGKTYKGNTSGYMGRAVSITHYYDGYTQVDLERLIRGKLHSEYFDIKGLEEVEV